jgi:uncharacterized damage-inducible protein DinB
MTNQDELRYPTGKWNRQAEYSAEENQRNLHKLASFPDELNQYVSQLSSEQLSNTYREGSWTIGQVLNHLVDSHLNAYIRFKFNYCEHVPVIKAYNENEWVLTPDCETADPQECLQLLNVIHARMERLCLGFKAEDWERRFFHSERKVLVSMAENLSLYAWHGHHHLGHIKIAAGRK